MNIALQLLEIERCKREDVYNAIWLRFLKSHNDQDARLMEGLRAEIDQLSAAHRVVLQIFGKN